MARETKRALAKAEAKPGRGKRNGEQQAAEHTASARKRTREHREQATGPADVTS